VHATFVSTNSERCRHGVALFDGNDRGVAPAQARPKITVS